MGSVLLGCGCLSVTGFVYIHPMFVYISPLYMRECTVMVNWHLSQRRLSCKNFGRAGVPLFAAVLMDGIPRRLTATFQLLCVAMRPACLSQCGFACTTTSQKFRYVGPDNSVFGRACVLCRSTRGYVCAPISLNTWTVLDWLNWRRQSN